MLSNHYAEGPANSSTYEKRSQSGNYLQLHDVKRRWWRSPSEAADFCSMLDAKSGNIGDNLDGLNSLSKLVP